MAQPKQQPDELVGQVFEDLYEVEKPLGAGGMGTVYLARHLRLGNRVVVKVPQAHEHTLNRRLEAEIDQLKGLQHPHIVKVRDKIWVRGLPCAVLDYLPGGDLSARLGDRSRTMTPSQVLGWLQPVAKALSHLHDRDIIHRDVKPGNIVFDDSGEAMLVDFGIAKVPSEPGPTAAGVFPGSPNYMAPELEATPAYDQFALATVVYECLTGQLPWNDSDPGRLIAIKQRKAPESLKNLNAEIPNRIDECVLKALSREPRERFASCIEFAETFASVAADLPEATVPNETVTLDPPRPPLGARLGELARSRSLRIALTIAVVGSVPLLLWKFWPAFAPGNAYTIQLEGQPEEVRVSYAEQQWTSKGPLGTFDGPASLELSRPGYRTQKIDVRPSLKGTMVPYSLAVDCGLESPKGLNRPVLARLQGLPLETEFDIAGRFDFVNVVGAGCRSGGVIKMQNGLQVTVDGDPLAGPVDRVEDLEPLLRSLYIRNLLLGPVAPVDSLKTEVTRRIFGRGETPRSASSFSPEETAFIYTRSSDISLENLILLLVEPTGDIVILYPQNASSSSRRTTNWSQLSRLMIKPSAGQDFIVALASDQPWTDVLQLAGPPPGPLDLWKLDGTQAVTLAEELANQLPSVRKWARDYHTYLVVSD